MLQRVQKNTPPHFVTKRVADPNMIPMLVAAGVEFGAVKVCPAAECIPLLAAHLCHNASTDLGK